MRGSGSAVIQLLPSLQRTLDIGRAGAQNVVTSTSTPITQIIGGNTGNTLATGTINLLGLKVTAEGRAILFMAIAMSLHYLGYSLARPSTLSLFTSSKTGFSKSSAFPLAMAFVSPVSLLLLMGYGQELDTHGPRLALRNTTLYCAMVLTVSALLIQKFSQNGATLTFDGYASIPLVKAVVGALFVFRESYVQLLTSQMWSFMVSVSTPAQSATWFAPISGLTSITSALAGLWVSRLTSSIGLTGVLVGAGLSLLASIIFADHAYSISERVSFIGINHFHYYLSRFANFFRFLKKNLQLYFFLSHSLVSTRLKKSMQNEQKKTRIKKQFLSTRKKIYFPKHLAYFLEFRPLKLSSLKYWLVKAF